MNKRHGVLEAKRPILDRQCTQLCAQIRPILDRQCTRLCAYVTANFKCVFLRLKLSTLGMFSVQ